MTQKTPRIDQRRRAALPLPKDDNPSNAPRKDHKSVMIDIKMHGFTRELMATVSNIVTSLHPTATPPHIPYGLPPTRTLITVNRSPHGHKKARDQFHLTHHGMILKGLRRHAGTTPPNTHDARRAPLNTLRDALLDHPVVQKGLDVKLHITGGKLKR